MYRRLWFLLTCAALGPASPAAASSIDKVLVVVNEEAVTLSEYQARHQREMLEQSVRIAPFDGRIDERILERMIDDRIQAQVAISRGIAVSPAQVEQSVAQIAGRNNASPDQLFEQLAREGITRSQFKASIREQELIRRLFWAVVNSRVAVSDREVENYLASHRELTASDDLFELSHLLVSVGGKTDAEVQSEYENLEFLRRGLLEGRPFEQFVQTHSDNPDKGRGGYIGWRKVNQLPDSFVAALRQTEVDGISPIIRSDNGLHVLKLHARKKEEKIVQQQRIRHILIRPDPGLNIEDAGQVAGQLRAQIAAGEESFEKIARVRSADQSSGADGGMLGWVNPGDFPPAFERAARELPLNQVSEPVRTSAGYHLIEVLERRAGDISAELTARRARQAIFERKAGEFYENWYGALRDSAYIEYIAVNPG